MENIAQLLKDELKEVRNDIKELRREVTQYKGFVGGVLWTGAALFTVFQIIVKWLGGHSL